MASGGIVIDSTCSYVYEQVEVKWTGRTAASTHANAQAAHVLYEITPIDQTVGCWKKWVRIVDLYKIVQ